MLMKNNPGASFISAMVEGWEKLVTGRSSELPGCTEDLALALAMREGTGKQERRKKYMV